MTRFKKNLLAPEREEIFFADFTSLLFCHWAHTVAVEAVVPIRVVAVTIEFEVVRAAGTTRRRRTPVVAVRAPVAKTITVAKASSGKKDTVAILFTLYLVTIDAIELCPCPGTLIYEFIEL